MGGLHASVLGARQLPLRPSARSTAGADVVGLEASRRLPAPAPVEYAESREYVGGDFYRFIPHNYGPFSREVYSDADSLAADGYIIKERRAGQSWPAFTIALPGRARARELKTQAPADGVLFLEWTVGWVKSLGFYDLVQSIYRHYPEYRANSVFRD